MTRRRTSLPTALALATFVATLLAPLVAAAEDGARAEPPRSIIQPAAELAAADRASPAAGLTTSRAPEVLREQLGLPAGAGLVVEGVVAGSAADRAGLKRHDVLVSLDDQWLVLPDQIAALATAAAPHAPLVLDVRRAGRPLSLALGTAGVPAVEAERADAPSAPPAPTRTVNAPPSPAATPLPSPPPAATRAEAMPPLPGARRLGPDAVILEDRDCRLKVYRDGDTRLSVRDARGWLVFNGPIATPAQRSLIPRRVRDRVERLELMLDAVTGAAEPSPLPADPPRAAAAVAATTTPAAPAAAPAAPPAVVAPGPAPPDLPVAEVGSLDVAPIEIR